MTTAKTSAAGIAAQCSNRIPTENGDDHAAGADGRTDRQIELATDHQQCHGHRQDAQLGGNFEVVRCASRRKESPIAREHGKEIQTTTAPATAPISGLTSSRFSKGIVVGSAVKRLPREPGPWVSPASGVAAPGRNEIVPAGHQREALP